MKWILKNGKIVNKVDNKYRIKYNKPSPSKGAQAVKDWIRENLFNDIWFEEYTIPSTRLKIDFLNATRKFAIEFNGVQHNKFVPFFHGNKFKYVHGIKNDLIKAEFLEGNGYTFIELIDEDLKNIKEKLILSGVNL